MKILQLYYATERPVEIIFHIIGSWWGRVVDKIDGFIHRLFTDQKIFRAGSFFAFLCVMRNFFLLLLLFGSGVDSGLFL